MRPLPRLASGIEWTPALRIAAGCVVLVLVVDLALLVRAARTRVDPPVVPLRLASAPPIVPRVADAGAPIESAGARQPFAPLGGAPTLASDATVIPQAAAMPDARPRLVGTVSGGASSFVVMALPDASIKVVRIGERAGNLTLRSVSAGGATFDDTNGERVTLRAPTPGAEPQP
jgi:hypothetical protein